MDTSLPSTTEKEEGVLESLGGIKRRKPGSMRLHLTAMIDVIFLLLTFFVLTARFRGPEQFLPVTLPRAQAQAVSVNVIEPLVLNVRQETGGFVIGLDNREYVIGEATLEQDLSGFANGFIRTLEQQRRGTGDPLELRCDEHLRWDYLVKLYNVLYGMGATEIQFDL